jgi:hypothetical protein
MGNPSIPTIARKLYDTGFTPWGVRHDGTKAPAAGKPWRDVDDQPDWDELAEMFTEADTGLGILTGRASGYLELLEFEGRAIAEGTYDGFCDRLIDAGMDETWDKISEGYWAVSGGGGYHFMFRVDGDCQANTKLAQRPATPEELDAKPTERTKTLIETRGQGGFVIVPPSNGKVHPHGGSWKLAQGSFSKIVTITVAERDALYDIAESFDEVARIATTYHQLPGERVGTAAELQDWVAERVGVAALLEEDGWTPERPRRDGQQYWTRPGKDPREGHSGSLFPDGGFLVWTSTYNDAWRDVLLSYESGWQGCTPVGVLAAVRFDGDISAAMSWVRKQISAETKAPEPSTGLNLSDEFWERSQLLRDVRDAAWAQLVSPDAVLGALLVRYSATVHPSVTLPGRGSLDLFVVCVGHSGAGKSQAAKTARMLFEGAYKRGVLLDLPIGSGEGLVEKYFRFEDEEGKPCSAKKKGATKVQWLHGLHFTTDEGMALAAQAGRQGSTLIPTLCQAWMGETLGQTNSQAETSRAIGPNKARLTAQINIQTANGHKLFAEEYASTGLAQRMLCVHALDERISDETWALPAMPPPLNLPMPVSNREMAIDATITAEIVAERRAAHSPTWMGDPLDTHRNMVKLKVAALYALMDGRDSVAVSDWELADEIYDVHRRIRSVLEATHQMEAARKVRQGAVAEAMRTIEVGRVQLDAVLVDATENIRRRIREGRSIHRSHLPARLRDHRQEALERLAEEGLVYEDDDGWHVTE